MCRICSLLLTVLFLVMCAGSPTRAATSVESDEDAVELWMQKGFAARERQDFQGELDAFMQARILDPDNPNVRLELGTAYMDLGNTGEALSIWEKLVEEYPSNFALKNNLAWVYATTTNNAIKNGVVALAYAKEALLLGPVEYQIWNTMAASYNVLGEYNKALSAAERALELAVESGAIASEIEMCREQVRTNRRLAEAVTAEDMGDDDVAYWTKMGQYELKKGRFRQALGAFSIARTHNAKDRAARFGEATVYIQIRKFREGLELLEELAEEYPQDYAIRNNIAWIYATAEDFSVRDGEKAVDWAQSALLLAPNDYHVWSTLAEAYFMAGDYDKAKRSAESALQQARLSSASPRAVETYQRQVDKSVKAAEAMSLIE